MDTSVDPTKVAEERAALINQLQAERLAVVAPVEPLTAETLFKK